MDSTTPTQTAAGAAAMMGPITTVHLIIIAILTVLTIAMIVWGTRLKAKRKAAEAETQEHREAIEAHGGGAADAPTVETPLSPSAADAAPAPVPVAIPSASASPEQSDLTRLKGLGPKLAAQLAERGLTRVEQIAALSPTEAAALDSELGSFSGRLSRDRWVEQAQLLAAGDTAGYEAQFGKL